MINLGAPLTSLATNFIVVDPFKNEYSVLLDGVDEYGNADSLLNAIGSNAVGSLVFWVKPVDATPASARGLVQAGDTDGIQFFQANMTSSGTLFVQSRLSLATTYWSIQTDNAVFSDNTWALVAVVQDGVSPVIYIDGVAVPQTITTSTDTTQWFSNLTSLDNIRVGCLNRNNSGNINFFNGNFDEMQFFDYALSASEVLGMYNGGSAKSATSLNPVSNHRFGDEDTHPVITDNSSNTNDITLVNTEVGDIEMDVPA